MKIHRLFAVLFCITISLPAAAQHTITLRGDTVTSVTIKEDNSYCDRSKRPPEMVYPPSAWVGYMAWDGKHQILLERNARCTKSTEMDSATWLQLDSLMAEIGVSRPATAAELGITEKMIQKTLHSRSTRRYFGRSYINLINDQVSLESFDRWLMEQYNEYKDTNSLLIMTDTYGFINIEIHIDYTKCHNVSIWRHYPGMPYDMDGLNRFNLNIYRHLCALIPKNFHYSYKDFQEGLIKAYFSYLIYDI